MKAIVCTRYGYVIILPKIQMRRYTVNMFYFLYNLEKPVEFSYQAKIIVVMVVFVSQCYYAVDTACYNHVAITAMSLLSLHSYWNPILPQT